MTTSGVDGWAAQELESVALGDQRLKQRLVRLVHDLALRPESSLPQASASWAATKAAYRFFDNDRVLPQAIGTAHQQATCARLPESGALLVVQDTTLLDFTRHPATTGLGHLIHRKHFGLLAHSALLLSDAGVPLGLLHQQVWARDPQRRGQRQTRRQRPTAAKESQRWLDTLAATEAALPTDREVYSLADREADFYDLLAAPRRRGHHLLLRAKQRRSVQYEGGLLATALRAQPRLGQYTVELRRGDDRPARTVVLALRYGAFWIDPPLGHRQRRHLPRVQVWAVLAEEQSPPATPQPVCWLLLSTKPITTPAEAGQAVQRYCRRWLVERLHFVLKSGCRIEQLQLETAARLQRAIATYSIVAWRLLWLTYQARQQPRASCTQLFELRHWQLLHRAVHPSQPLPATPPTLAEAVQHVARLGGFLARRHDGLPGVQVLWRGLRRLQDLLHGASLLSPEHNKPPPTYG
jgi:hypothetical protein